MRKSIITTLAIVSNDDSSSVSSALTKANFQVTRLATTGGFLRAGNTTMIVGTDDDKVDQAIEIIGNESIIPAPVISLNSFTCAAVIAISFSS